MEKMTRAIPSPLAAGMAKQRRRTPDERVTRKVDQRMKLIMNGVGNTRSRNCHVKARKMLRMDEPSIGGSQKRRNRFSFLDLEVEESRRVWTALYIKNEIAVAAIMRWMMKRKRDMRLVYLLEFNVVAVVGIPCMGGVWKGEAT